MLAGRTKQSHVIISMLPLSSFAYETRMDEDRKREAKTAPSFTTQSVKEGIDS